MKKTNILFVLLLFSLASVAQGIRYDTIRVSPNDARNIHRTTTTPKSSKQVATKVQSPKTKSQYSNTSGSGYSFDVSKLRYGADLGLYFSNHYSSFNFGPQVGYQLSNQVMLGAGAKYYYLKNKDYYNQQEIVNKNNLLGINAFGYFYPMGFIVLFVQPEINHSWSVRKNKDTGDSVRSDGFVPAFLIGGGLRLGMTHVTLNYDLGRHSDSPYSKGVFVGISVFI